LASQTPYFTCLFLLVRAWVNTLKRVVHINIEFKNSVPTLRRIQWVYVTKINRLLLVRK
jgi:hypothetical protein